MPRNITHNGYLIFLPSIPSIPKRSVKTPPDDEINFTGFTTSGPDRSKLNIVYGISQADVLKRCYYTPCLARHAVDVRDR